MKSFYLMEGEAAVCSCVLTKALIFLSIWFYCNKLQDAPSVTAMGKWLCKSLKTRPHPDTVRLGLLNSLQRCLVKAYSKWIWRVWTLSWLRIWPPPCAHLLVFQTLAKHKQSISDQQLTKNWPMTSFLYSQIKVEQTQSNLGNMSKNSTGQSNYFQGHHAI